MLLCVGAFADRAIDSIRRPRRSKKRTSVTSRNHISRGKCTPKKVVRVTPDLKITTPDKYADKYDIGDVTGRSADSDNETIGHADDFDAEIGHSAVAIDKRA